MPEPRTNAERSFAERLTDAIQSKKSCVVVGLDPVLERLPPETFSVIGAAASGGEGLTARASVANRSGKDQLDGLPLVSLLQPDFPVWSPEECPLCAEGGAAIKQPPDFAKMFDGSNPGGDLDNAWKAHEPLRETPEGLVVNAYLLPRTSFFLVCRVDS